MGSRAYWDSAESATDERVHYVIYGLCLHWCVCTIFKWFYPCHLTRRTRVTRTHPLDVASCHASTIRILRFVLVRSMNLHFRSRFHCCARLKIKNPSLIKTMFPLHVSFCLGCKYVSSLEERSLGKKLGENKRKMRLKVFSCLFPPPFYGGLPFVVAGNHCFFAGIQHALGTRSGEFHDCDCGNFRNENSENSLFACPRRRPAFPAEGHEECFHFINVLRTLKTDPGAPQVSLESSSALERFFGTSEVYRLSLGSSRSFGTPLIQHCDPRAPRDPLGLLGPQGRFWKGDLHGWHAASAVIGSLEIVGDILTWLSMFCHLVTVLLDSKN